MSRASRNPKSPTSPLMRSPSGQSVASPLEYTRRPTLGRNYHSRRSSTASSIHTTSGAQEAASFPDVIAESGENAISTLLQTPIVRTGLLPHSSAPSSVRPPSVRDIPPVTLTNTPRVDNSTFKNYLEKAGDLYEVFQRSRDPAGQRSRSSSRNGRRTSDTSSDGHAPGHQRRPSADQSLKQTSSSDSVNISSPSTRRGSGGLPRRNPLTVAPLSTIPSVYFEEDFHLENARTFDIVSERSEIARPLDANGAPVSPSASGKKGLAANAILQEKLSWYMDTVEIHLISSISTASTSFFAALGSLRSLHDEAAECVSKIKTLRKDLGNLDDSMAVGGLEIVRKKRRRENLRRLADAVEQLQCIAEHVADCEDRVEGGLVDEALAGLADVEKLIAGEAPKSLHSKNPSIWKALPGNLIDLRSIKALEGASADIEFLRKRIGKVYEAKFIETLLQDLRKHVDSVPTKSTFARWEKASGRLRGQHIRTPSEFPIFLNIEEGFRSTLQVQLKGLARSESVMTAAMAYRDAILKEFKNTIRRHLPSSSDEDAESTTSIATHESRALSSQEKSSILARNLRALDADDAMDMLKSIYSNVGEGLRRLGTQVKVLLDITSSLENPNPNPSFLKSPPRTPQLGSLDQIKSPGTPPIFVRQEEIQQALDLSNLLGQAVDIAQSQITKVLKVRVEQTTHWELNYFLKYFTLNRLFADECEAVSGRGGSALKNAVHEHIKTFVNLAADAQRQKLVQKMDADEWSAQDFTDEQNQRLRRIMDAGTSDIEEWTKLGSLWDEDPGTPKAKANGVIAVQETPNGTAAKEKIRPAVIDEEKYLLPASAMAVETGIESYMKLLAGIPSMSTEISSSLLEYLKLFNSRSSQLILGAGATRSAGLKNITTKHLALSSQSLSFVVAIIPYVREFARRHLPQSSALMTDFDKVKRLFQEHQSGIHDKLVEIMTGRATAHVNSMKKIDWDDENAPEKVNMYMETLIKETTTLHRVLARHLPDASIMMIMQPVLASYQDQWTKAFNSATLKTEKGKQRLVRDADFFMTRISKIEGAAGIGEAVSKLANEKSIQPVEQASTQQSSTDSTASESKDSSGSS